MTPGTTLRRLAAACCGAETMARVVDPLLADLRFEYEQGAAAGARRWLVLARGYVAFLKTLALLALHFLLAAVRPGRDTLAWRTLAETVVPLAIATVVLAAPPLFRGFPRGGGFGDVILAATLIPQTLPLTLPLAVMIGVLRARRGRPATTADFAGVLMVAAVVIFVSWCALEWLIPAANQAFRVETARRLAPAGIVPHIEPGLNELGLSRLATLKTLSAMRHHQLLWAICVAALPLSLCALTMARWIHSSLGAVFAALGLAVLYWATMFLVDAGAPQSWYTVHAEPWLPNLLFLGIAFSLLRFRQDSTVS